MRMAVDSFKCDQKPCTRGIRRKRVVVRASVGMPCGKGAAILPVFRHLLFTVTDFLRQCDLFHNWLCMNLANRQKQDILRKDMIRTFLMLLLPAGEGWGGGSKVKIMSVRSIAKKCRSGT